MFTNWLTSPPTSSVGPLQTNIVASPPDVVLEVGPTPSTRFMAHSMLLAMHSGYLRSAIRLDENGVQSSELPIFLTNVTPEQFAPLLTYMYTGYLDLNIENIFGVLLATHVLHMPRALEICRAFLSRTQSEGYLSGSFLSQINENNTSTGGTKSSGVKVIRPIASKPAIPNLGFIVPPMPHISLPSTGTPFRSLHNQHKDLSKYHSKMVEKQEDTPAAINVTDSPKASGSTKDGATKKTSKVKKSLSNEKTKRSTTITTTTTSTTTTTEPSSAHRKEAGSDNENKIIIDVASCDGPVRFRRVLNDAYGRQPQITDNLHIAHQERSHQSVSNSFHQQMAKNISQRQQSEEVENSEDLKAQQSQSQQSANGSGEVYNCVYCKHTFKSQYCYQKHAKRHLNPLSLEANEGGSISSDTDKEERVTSRCLDGKREVRPLDMNVQYYPCKTCGSKFPSYYFVHKHRKMCHANEESG